MMTWTLEQAAELCLEQFLELLDGCEDDDTVRPEMVAEAIRQVWAPNSPLVDLRGANAGEIRQRIASARLELANGALIP